MWLEGLGQVKNPMTSSGTEPVTFWVVVQCLNQLCCHMPVFLMISGYYDPYIFAVFKSTLIFLCIYVVFERKEESNAKKRILHLYLAVAYNALYGLWFSGVVLSQVNSGMCIYRW
jgi:hypothetical protein